MLYHLYCSVVVTICLVDTMDGFDCLLILIIRDVELRSIRRYNCEESEEKKAVGHSTECEYESPRLVCFQSYRIIIRW